MTDKLRHVSDEELARYMRPRIDALLRNVVPARHDQAHAPCADGTGSKRTEGKDGSDAAHARGGHHHRPELSDDELEYLRSVTDRPLLTITQRRDALALSSDAANRIKRKLVELGLVEQVRINLGTRVGGTVTYLELTAEGWQLLGKKPAWERPRNTSAEHFWWQRQIASFYQSHGWQVAIEMNLNGKRADVGARKGQESIAIEVELTPGNAVRNVIEDLSVGFSCVVLAAKNERVRKAIETRLTATLDEEQRSKVKLTLLSGMPFVEEVVNGTRA